MRVKEPNFKNIAPRLHVSTHQWSRAPNNYHLEYYAKSIDGTKFIFTEKSKISRLLDFNAQGFQTLRSIQKLTLFREVPPDVEFL